MINKYFVSLLYLILKTRNSHHVVYSTVPTASVQGFNFSGRFASVGLNRETDFQSAIWAEKMTVNFLKIIITSPFYLKFSEIMFCIKLNKVTRICKKYSVNVKL